MTEQPFQLNPETSILLGVGNHLLSDVVQKSVLKELIILSLFDIAGVISQIKTQDVRILFKCRLYF
jgi:hypothetical protein